MMSMTVNRIVFTHKDYFLKKELCHQLSIWLLSFQYISAVWASQIHLAQHRNIAVL